MDFASAYLASLRAACSSTEDAPRPEVMDNTKHTASCTAVITPGIICICVIIWVLRTVLCPSKLRQTYSGSEDAPELEEIATTDPSRRQLRAASYQVRHGRLTSAPTGPSKGKKSVRSGRAQELEPVLQRACRH